MAWAKVRSFFKRRRVNGGVDRLERNVRRAMKGPTRVKVGLPAGTSSYPDGTSVFEVGAVHEFGSQDGRIPERSFIRSTLEKKRSELDAMAGKIGKKVERDGGTLEEGLNLMGSVLAAAIQETIADGVPPPNAPSTIRRKGSSKPLIDTGHLRQSITWQVVKKK